jgi:hypothetical protein
MKAGYNGQLILTHLFTRVARSSWVFTATLLQNHGPFKTFHGPKISLYCPFHGPNSADLINLVTPQTNLDRLSF